MRIQIVQFICDSTEQHLAMKIFYPDDCRYMLQVLPTISIFAQNSWAQFMYVRCQNCNSKPTNTAHGKKEDHLYSDVYNIS